MNTGEETPEKKWLKIRTTQEILDLRLEKIEALTDQLKQRDETIKQLKEALKEILMYCEEDGTPVDGFQLRDNILTAKRLIR